jgi:hypothetical protein
LRKLECEYARLQHDPGDVDTAFNFFVTAEHLPDWLEQDGKLGGRRAGDFKQSERMTRICSHLANSGKHFRPNSARHDAIQAGERRGSNGWAPEGWAPSGWLPVTYSLKVDLTPHLGGGTDSVLALATQVLEFWHIYPHW